MTNLVPGGNTSKSLSPQQQKIMNEIISHETHWMLRIFPTRVDMERMKYKVNVFKLQAESDYTMTKMHRDAMHQAFREALETMLINGKVKTRKERAEYFAQQATTLEQSFTHAIGQFMEVSQQRLERLTRINHAQLMELEKNAIEQSMDLFYGSLENMKNRFHDILKETVEP